MRSPLSFLLTVCCCCCWLCYPALADPQGALGATDTGSPLPPPPANSDANHVEALNSTSTTTTTHWQDEPNGRGTFSLIFSCLVTLTLCVWSALHLNVPTQHTGLRGRILEKSKWVLYGIFAPELVVATAAAQFIVARWLKGEIEKDARYRAAAGLGLNTDAKTMTTHTWTLSQCFYAVMGGFAADSEWVDFRSRSQGADANVDVEGGVSTKKRVAVTPEGIRLLSFLGKLPHVHEEQIEDKSKADWMAKSIICVQAGWMVIQVIGRVIKNMPVSLLEINTCGHVACALAIYLLWWSKPLDIQEPTVLDDDNDDQYKDALSLMYMCSSIGAVNGITDIRCFIHTTPEDDDRLWKLPSDSQPDDHQDKQTAATETATATATAPTEAPTELPGEEGQMTTYLSVGSPGAREPTSFLGFDDLWSGEEQPTSRTFRYKFNRKAPPISKDCLVYYSPPYTDEPRPSLRHSLYCRRGVQELRSKKVEEHQHQHQQKSDPVSKHTPVPPALLGSASKAADVLRAECSAEARPSYERYYFTFVPSLGLFLGETEYIVRKRIRNFPPLHNLGLGQVNIHRDRLRSVLALTAAAYGVLHCFGWPRSSPSSSNLLTKKSEMFPTFAEEILWLVSSLTIAASGALLWGFYLARQLWPGFDRWVSGVGPGMHIENQRRNKRTVMRIKNWTMYSVLAVFALARVYLVVEAFVSLRKAPVGLYDTPEWTDFLPHL